MGNYPKKQPKINFMGNIWFAIGTTQKYSFRWMLWAISQKYSFRIIFWAEENFLILFTFATKGPLFTYVVCTVVLNFQITFASVRITNK